jgi:hypothetical protein
MRIAHFASSDETIEKCQGWRLAPLGAEPAAATAASMTSRGTAVSLNIRQLRRDCITSLNARARAIRSASVKGG